MVMAGYNLEVEPAPMKIYIGKKGVDANGNALTEDANERDSFLGRNGLLYGQLYGMAATDETYAALGIEEVDADIKMMDEYVTNADAPDSFSARYIPTSYRWDGFDTPENANETELFRWLQDGDTLADGTVEADEQPEGYTFFNGDSKVEHPAVDPDITKHRYVQNLTVPSAQLGVEFTDMVNELENNDADGNGLPDYLSADVTRILAGVDGALTLDVGGKGKGHIGPNNPDGTRTHETHLEIDEARMHQPDGLQWIKTSDGDYLIVDEDSGNDYGERKFILPIDSETMQLKEDGKGYLLAAAGGSLHPRAIGEVAAIPDTFSSATSSEFSGTWNVTHLVETKEDGSFYTKEEISGVNAQEIIGSKPLAEQTLLGVVQHRGESGGIVEERLADQGGQVFLFNVNGNVANGGLPVEIRGTSRKDEITGTDANEIIFGGGTRDIINGGGGNDQIYGEGGNDFLSGGEGDDIIYGGVGNDKAIGDAGMDTFVMMAGGATRVMDFTVGEDKIGLADGLSFGQLSIEKRGKNALISSGDEIIGRVMNTQVSALTEEMFVEAM